MKNTVERVKYVLKTRGIPVAKLETDLGFANGYIASLRRGTLPAERLSSIAKYLGLSSEYLMGEEDKYGLTFDDWMKIGGAYKTVGNEVEDYTKLVSKIIGINENNLKWFFDGVGTLPLHDILKLTDHLGTTLEKMIPEYAETISRCSKADFEAKEHFFAGYGENLSQEKKDEYYRYAQEITKFTIMNMKKKEKENKID